MAATIVGIQLALLPEPMRWTQPHDVEMEANMSKSIGNVLPFRPTSSRKIDLAMALARLSKGVRAREAATRQAQLFFLRRLVFGAVAGHGHGIV